MDEPTQKIETPDAEEPVVIPPNLKLRLEKCPKCEYERRKGDDDFASPYECPKCGVVYALAMEEVRRRDRGRELQDEAEVDELRRLAREQNENIHSSQVGGAMFVGQEKSRAWMVVAAILVLAGLAAYVFL
jgi:DNA-directed RNA polymerase subunit M/transcription elongation factor TFIIS